MDFKECRYCKARYVGCHSHCPSYINTKKRINEIRENKIKIMNIENYFIGKRF